MKLKIISDGTMAGTKVVNVETGAADDALVIDAAKHMLRTEGEFYSRLFLFAGHEPGAESNTRKAKRLYRESRRLYKWEKKWAERQV